MNLEIPTGLTTLLQDFTVAVLRERPTDLVQFAADYFQNLNSDRVNNPSSGNTPKKVGLPATSGNDSDEEAIGEYTRCEYNQRYVCSYENEQSFA